MNRDGNMLMTHKSAAAGILARPCGSSPASGRACIWATAALQRCAAIVGAASLVCDNVGIWLVLHCCDAKECVPASALHPAAGYCHSSSWPVAITVSGGKAARTAAFCSSVKAFGKAML